MSEKLIAAIQDAEDNSQKPELAEERAKAIAYYNGDAFGNEVDGRSQYVSRDVHNAIEGIKPSILKIFASTDEVVKFVPQCPEDIEASEQEGAFLNYLFTQKNNGFLILEQWFHDALLLKNGYVKAFWDVTENVETERYAALTEDEVALLLQDQSVEVVSQEQNEYGLYSIEVQTKKEYGCVKVINLPPEQVIVSHNCPSVDVGEADFVEHWDYKSITWLRENGFKVEDDIADESSESYEEFIRSRASYSNDYGDELTNDPTMRMVKVREVWIRFDENEDGKAELIHAIVVGNEILLQEEADEIPLACICPYPLPHRHIGRSVADDTMHYQELNSFLIRSYNDNLALVNNGRHAISDRVNLSDMLVSRPGGVVRVDGEPGGAIMPLVHPTQGPQILQGLEYFNTLKENDTGVTRYNQGLDSNSLNKTATGISKIMSASQERIMLIARNFAEVGIKRLFWLMHKTAKQNYTQPEYMRLRNKWVAVDPRSWKTRYDLVVNVGIGTGDKDQQLIHLQNILMAQKEAIMIGVATPQNIYHALTKLTENAGFKDVENFWTNPENTPPAPPQPNPDEMKLQADMQKSQAEMQMKQQQAEFDAMLEQQKAQAQMEIERQRLELEREKAILQAQTAIEVAKVKADADMQTQVQVASTGAQNELDRIKMQQDGEVATQVKEQSSAAQQELMGAFMEAMQAMVEQISKPKQVVRGPDGRVVGVQ